MMSEPKWKPLDVLVSYAEPERALLILSVGIDMDDKIFVSYLPLTIPQNREWVDHMGAQKRTAKVSDLISEGWHLRGRDE